MTTYNTQNHTSLLLQNITKNITKRSYTLSPEAELITILLFLALLLSIAAVALVHTLSMFASALGAPLFTLMIPCLALISAALVPVLRNPIHALLCLLSLFAATGLIYLSLGAEYLGIVFIIVYLGAVAILFLYVIMLLNVKDIMSAQTASSSRGLRYALSTAAGLLLFFHLPVEVQDGFQAATLFSTDTTTGADHSATAELVSHLATDILHLRSLYGDNWPAFMLITVILLFAMLGAIVLATGSVEEDKVLPFLRKMPNSTTVRSILFAIPSITETAVDTSDIDGPAIFVGAILLCVFGYIVIPPFIAGGPVHGVIALCTPKAISMAAVTGFITSPWGIGSLLLGIAFYPQPVLPINTFEELFKCLHMCTTLPNFRHDVISTVFSQLTPSEQKHLSHLASTILDLHKERLAVLATIDVRVPSSPNLLASTQAIWNVSVSLDAAALAMQVDFAALQGRGLSPEDKQLFDEILLSLRGLLTSEVRLAENLVTALQALSR